MKTQRRLEEACRKLRPLGLERKLRKKKKKGSKEKK